MRDSRSEPCTSPPKYAGRHRNLHFWKREDQLFKREARRDRRHWLAAELRAFVREREDVDAPVLAELEERARELDAVDEEWLEELWLSVDDDEQAWDDSAYGVAVKQPRPWERGSTGDGDDDA